MKTIANLKVYQENFRRDKFGRKILEIIPELNPYVRHRLYIATELGIIPKNMYVDSDIVDEAIVSLFEGDLSAFQNKYDLKIELFRLVKQKLDTIFQKESWHQKSMSTDKLLHQELNNLKERFTFDGDPDSVMNEELADISYHQKDFSVPLKLYDDAEHSVISAFDLKQWDEPQKSEFNKMYNYLSLEASNVVDLHIFGKLSSAEIANIKGVSEPVIREIILQVKDRISNLLSEKV